jgi:hypothetical protein
MAFQIQLDPRLSIVPNSRNERYEWSEAAGEPAHDHEAVLTRAAISLPFLAA